MHKTLTISALAVLAFAETHEVTIGPGLSYSPDSITAAQGDVINFKFGSGHDVVSGSFDSPCTNDGNIYSGMGEDGEVFSMQINSTDPMWLYCSVPGHCQRGMAMVINAPSDKTLDEYKSAANGASSSNAPDEVAGGVLGASAYEFGSSGSATSSSAAAASSTAASAASSSVSSASASASASASSASGSASSAAASATGSSGADSLSIGMAGVAAMGFWALL